MVGGKGQYNKRAESVVAECVAHLAVVLGKDDLWQKLNYQLLLKTRHKKRYVSRLLVDDIVLFSQNHGIEHLGEHFCETCS